MTTIGDTINTLKDMGFSEALAKKALTKTNWTGTEAAAEWLLSHPDDGVAEDVVEESITSEEHSNTSEAPMVKLNLTEEERAQQVQRMEELRKKKRAEREEKEKRDAIEVEKKRVEDGKSNNNLKQQMEEKEIKKIAEDRVREKRENQLAKERVKAQIEQDKKERKDREARQKGEILTSTTVNPPSNSINSTTTQKDYTQTRIQIRQLDGKPLVHTFQAKETLSAVRLHVQLNRQDQPGVAPTLMSNYPKKTFRGEDYDTPLDILGLVPSAGLMISKN